AGTAEQSHLRQERMRVSGRQSLSGFSAGLILASVGLSGCKDTNGPENSNAAPTADFSTDCTDLTCRFTSLSGDRDGQVSKYKWEFGDGMQSANQGPSHTFSAPGDYAVSLTVTDNDGATGSVTKTVDVTAPVGGAPTAAFTVTCFSLDCTFADNSTDANGTVVAWAW